MRITKVAIWTEYITQVYLQALSEAHMASHKVDFFHEPAWSNSVFLKKGYDVPFVILKMTMLCVSDKTELFEDAHMNLFKRCSYWNGPVHTHIVRDLDEMSPTARKIKYDNPNFMCIHHCMQSPRQLKALAWQALWMLYYEKPLKHEMRESNVP